MSQARAETSRRNGAQSRGPKTPAGKARAAQNALKHGMRAQKFVVLPQEDAAAFQALEATLLDELAPEGALQTILARRIAVAAWRLARADRMEAEALAVRSYEGASPGLALIRDGNGTRAVETLLRYRSAAVAELMRALRTLQALQAEQAARGLQGAGGALALEVAAGTRAAAAPGASGRAPRPAPPQANGRKGCASREPAIVYAPANEPEPCRTLHEAPARWRSSAPAAHPQPNEPQPCGTVHEAPARWCPSPPAAHPQPNEPEAAFPCGEWMRDGWNSG